MVWCERQRQHVSQGSQGEKAELEPQGGNSESCNHHVSRKWFDMPCRQPTDLIEEE